MTVFNISWFDFVVSLIKICTVLVLLFSETEKKIIEVKVMKYDKYWFNTVIEVEEIVMLSSEHIDDYTNNTKPYDFHKSYNSSSSTLAQNVARDKVYEKPYR